MVIEKLRMAQDLSDASCCRDLHSWPWQGPLFRWICTHGRRFVLETHEQRFKLPVSWLKLGADGVLVQPVNTGKNDSCHDDRYCMRREPSASRPTAPAR